MMHLRAETENLSQLFQSNNIPAIYLKGQVLAEDLYGDISLRTSSDLDILIPMKELEKADEYLTEVGYIKDDYIHTVLNDWKWRHHHFTYFHPVKGIKAEIHWRLNPGPAKEPPFQDLWKRKRTSHLTNLPISLLGTEDLFLFLVSHGARHGWSRLRWLADIDRLIRKGMDIKKTVKLLKKYQYLHIGGQAILLTLQLLNTPLTNDLRKIADSKRSRKLAQDALFYFQQQINLHSEPLPAEVAIYHKQHLYELMSFQQKVMFSLSVLYPYPIDAETFPLPKPLHFLYFPLHPMLFGHGEKCENRHYPRRISMSYLLAIMKRLFDFSGKILYLNLLGMGLISLLEGGAIFLLMPLINLSGIVNMGGGSTKISHIFGFLEKFPPTNSAASYPLLLCSFGNWTKRFTAESDDKKFHDHSEFYTN